MDQDIKGKELLQQIDHIDPSYGEHFYDLAGIFREKKEYQKAEEAINKYLRHFPDDIKIQIFLAEIKQEQGNFKEASSILYRLKKEHPENEEIISALARLFHILGQKESAIELVDELVSLQGNRADPDDISGLNDSLELYEKIVQTFEDEQGEEWEKNLQKLGKMAATREELEKEEKSPEREEESIPVLDFQEDFFADPEELIFEEEESVPDKEEAPFEEEPVPNLFSLLEDQGKNQREPSQYPNQSIPPSVPANQNQGGFPQQQYPQPQGQSSPQQQVPQNPPQAYPQPAPIIIQPQAPPVQYSFMPPETPKKQGGRRATDRNPPVRSSGGSPPEKERRKTDRRKKAERRSAEDRRSGKDRRDYTKPDPEFLFTEEGIVPFFERRTSDRRQGGERRKGEPQKAVKDQETKHPESTKPRQITDQEKANLLEYLLDLSTSLPPEKKEEFIRTEIPLKIAMLKAELSGKDGLKNEIERIFTQNISSSPITPKKIKEVFAYLSRTVMYHPDIQVGTILREKLEKIMKKVSAAEQEQK
jgi:tetratricopeptide (TPR) repeat protein